MKEPEVTKLILSVENDVSVPFPRQGLGGYRLKGG